MELCPAHGIIHYVIVDFARVATAARMDVYPGEEEIVDVAVRLDNELDCYGWNDEAYTHNWRNPNWKLPPGRYLVRVVVTSSGHKCIGHFRLINDVDNRADFRLASATPQDDAYLS